MTVQLRPMTPAEVEVFVAASYASYVTERIEAGEDREEAERVVHEQRAATFPGGVPAPGHRLYRVVDDGQAVGSLWLGPGPGGTPGLWWVWEVRIDEEHRGRGVGTAVMVLAEDEARATGATELGLNVFGHNSGARRLYERLGYSTVAMRMAKRL